MKYNINLCIMPECYLDTNLVETIVPPERIGSTCGYNHQHSCDKVIAQMIDKLKDKFALGIVDIDKNPLARTSEFKSIIEKKLPNESVLKLYKHPNKNHYLIFHTNMEKWLLNEAKNVNVSLADYDLPVTLKRYKDKNGKFVNGLVDEKGGLSKNDQRFKKLFRELIKKEAIGIKLLAEWIKYLKEHPDDADINELKKLS